MKRLTLLGIMVLVIVFLAAGMSDNTSKSPKAEEEASNIIKLTYKSKNQKIFKIYNPTDEPIRINSVTTVDDCNCKVPIWTTGRIKPGKHGLVMVVFNENSEGLVTIPLKVYFYNKEDVVDETLTQNIKLEVTLDARSSGKKAAVR